MAEWAGRHEIAIMAAGNRAVEAHALPEGRVAKQEFLNNQGGHLVELLNLEDLVREKVYEFQFVAAPLNIKKGLRSPITPLALC